MDNNSFLYEVPAELIIEKPHQTNDYYWVWSVCQPDAAWGEWSSGRAASKELAFSSGITALSKILRKQGFLE